MSLFRFSIGSFCGSFGTTIMYHYPSRLTLESSKKIAQITLISTLFAAASCTLSEKFADRVYDKTKNNYYASLVYTCSLLTSAVVINYAAKAFPHLLGTPKEAQITFDVSCLLATLTAYARWFN